MSGPNVDARLITFRLIKRQTSYDATDSKSSAIINSYFRYLHCVIAHTLFDLGDSEGVVHHSELLFMWVMGLEEVKGKNLVDLATCQAMKMITRISAVNICSHLSPSNPFPCLTPSPRSNHSDSGQFVAASTAGRCRDQRPSGSTTTRLFLCSRIVPWTSARLLSTDTRHWILDHQQ
ncbi:hypothetical protein Salat_2886300 [Sesamum alatum]|uniref:Uncharacterized protein n=1 Tax=Sesamum alatum TaxID=300844 RepID=A0AAE1XJ72_9LAMI|nr:hypothetical protein Salat_2886300 [Sesamum alatum]